MTHDRRLTTATAEHKLYLTLGICRAWANSHHILFVHVSGPANCRHTYKDLGKALPAATALLANKALLFMVSDPSTHALLSYDRQMRKESDQGDW